MPGYGQWLRFKDAVKRAMTSCQASGNNPDHHFAGAGRMVDPGSVSQRQVEDCHLSRCGTSWRETDLQSGERLQIREQVGREVRDAIKGRSASNGE